MSHQVQKLDQQWKQKQKQNQTNKNNDAKVDGYQKTCFHSGSVLGGQETPCLRI